MIEPGTYRARARTAAMGMTGTGKEQVAVLFDLLDHQGQSITWYGYWTEAAIDRTVESLRNCGWRGADVSDFTGIDANEVFIVIEHEDDLNGVPRARVKWVNGSGGLAMRAALDPTQVKTVAARLKGAILASDRSAGRTAHTNGKGGTPPAARTPSGGDDIPF